MTDWAHEIGYTYIGHDIIFGLPHQNLDCLIKTVTKTKSLVPDRLVLYSYAHVPWMKGNGQRGYKDSDLPSVDLKREQCETGKVLLGQLRYKGMGMNHFALKTDNLFISAQEGRSHYFMG
jgi:oxygen-independent coproporphyrinogen-3 oxidase